MCTYSSTLSLRAVSSQDRSPSSYTPPNYYITLRESITEIRSLRPIFDSLSYSRSASRAQTEAGKASTSAELRSIVLAHSSTNARRPSFTPTARRLLARATDSHRKAHRYIWYEQVRLAGIAEPNDPVHGRRTLTIGCPSSSLFLLILYCSI